MFHSFIALLISPGNLLTSDERIFLIKTEILKKYNYKFKNSKNFEQTFYPKIIKKYLTNFIKIDGFWHSIDNIKDLAAVDLKEAKNYKYNTLKKIKKFLL